MSDILGDDLEERLRGLRRRHRLSEADRRLLSEAIGTIQALREETEKGRHARVALVVLGVPEKAWMPGAQR